MERSKGLRMLVVMCWGGTSVECIEPWWHGARGGGGVGLVKMRSVYKKS